MVSAVVLEHVQGLMLPKMLTRSQLLDKYLKKYAGNDVICKDVIAAAKSLGVKVDCRKIDVGVITQVYVKAPAKKPEIIRKKEPVERVYVDDPIKLIDLKKKGTYKEIGKMYGVNANKIFDDIKHYKNKLLQQ
jgi:hypothetical protein